MEWTRALHHRQPAKIVGIFLKTGYGILRQNTHSLGIPGGEDEAKQSIKINLLIVFEYCLSARLDHTIFERHRNSDSNFVASAFTRTDTRHERSHHSMKIACLIVKSERNYCINLMSHE